jgi:hypothetical protein
MLAALGREPFEPTDDMRQMVSILIFNGTPEARIAEGLGLNLFELRYFFADELSYSKDRILGKAAATMIELAAQRIDLGVAFRAAALMLQSRLPSWREPKPEDARPPPEARIDTLNLQEVERELARLEGRTFEAGPAPAADEG